MAMLNNQRVPSYKMVMFQLPEGRCGWSLVDSSSRLPNMYDFILGIIPWAVKSPKKKQPWKREVLTGTPLDPASK